MAENHHRLSQRGLEREFVLLKVPEVNQVADHKNQQLTNSLKKEPQTSELIQLSLRKSVTTRKKLWQMRPRKRERLLSQETVGQVRTIQSGRQAEDIREEEQRKRVAEAMNVWQVMPTRPDAGNHSC